MARTTAVRWRAWPYEGKISEGGFIYHNGKWAKLHPNTERPFVLSHSRQTGIRPTDYRGLELTLANLPSESSHE